MPGRRCICATFEFAICALDDGLIVLGGRHRVSSHCAFLSGRRYASDISNRFSKRLSPLKSAAPFSLRFFVIKTLCGAMEQRA